MGQYYHPTMIDESGNIFWIYTHHYGDGLKLMEHSYIGNATMNAVLGIILDHPMRIAWIGDYSDEQYGDRYERKLPWEKFRQVYDAVYGSHQQDHLIAPTPMAHDTDSTGWYLVNHTEKSFLSLDAYIRMNKWEESWKNHRTGETESWDMCVHPLSLLTACGNDRGGGDYHSGYPGYDQVGSWAFDLIELTKKQPEQYREVHFSFSEKYREEAI
jgi:hypothetical protein